MAVLGATTNTRRSLLQPPSCTQGHLHVINTHTHTPLLLKLTRSRTHHRNQSAALHSAPALMPGGRGMEGTHTRSCLLLCPCPKAAHAASTPRTPAHGLWARAAAAAAALWVRCRCRCPPATHAQTRAVTAAGSHVGGCSEKPFPQSRFRPVSRWIRISGGS